MNDAVWIIDDDRSIRWVFEKALAREGITHRTFEHGQAALDALEQTNANNPAPQVVVSDIRMPGLSGLDLMKSLKLKHPTLPIIIMTAYSDLDSAVAAFQGGAFEYLPKPFDVNQAVDIVRRAIDESARHAMPAQELIADSQVVPEMLGQAPAMQEVFRAIGRLAQSHATVLINGESGTGKELVARALHRHSPRNGKAFIAINTAAIPKDLLESELFGHERGAFTGAQTLRRGRFEQADNGTLFLDEIGDMPAELQTRLLRVLADGEFYRVGGVTPVKVNVRVIAATHQDLEGRVKQGLFREDLFHRLNVIRLKLPALRERREDIPMLARYFLQKSARDLSVDAKQLSAAAIKHLGMQSFPGNVRQLENLCHWLTVMASGQVVDISDLPADFRDSDVAENSDLALSLGAMPQWRAALELDVAARLARGEREVFDVLNREFESALILQALQHTHGRRIEAAQLLGIGRNTLTRKVQELGLDMSHVNNIDA
jgi:two-component system, NtrC family, nitrogen regulation response regulator GlnG